MASKRQAFVNRKPGIAALKRRACLDSRGAVASSGAALLLARTIMPRRTLAIAHGQLTKLGNRPLGEIIFAYAHVARQALDVSYVMPNVWQPDIALLAHHAPVWGRRTVYIIEQQPLLVSEFFMPDLFTSGVTTHD